MMTSKTIGHGDMEKAREWADTLIMNGGRSINFTEHANLAHCFKAQTAVLEQARTALETIRSHIVGLPRSQTADAIWHIASATLRMGAVRGDGALSGNDEAIAHAIEAHENAYGIASPVDRMRCAIAAFLRQWKPSDLVVQQAVHWHDRAVSGIDASDPRVAALVHAAIATADELDPPAQSSEPSP